MSWLYSRALVEEFSAANCSVGEPFAPSSGIPTPQAYLPSDRTTDFLRPSLFGMTFEVLTDDLGEALLTWFLEDSRARTSALPERGPASTASGPDCGPRWRASLARFDPATCSWKTAQRSLLEDSDECSVTWPRSGMTAGGRCWELPMSGRRIGVIDSGSWPTPCATDAKPITGGNLYQTKTGTVRHIRPDGKSSNRGLATQVTWPTPTVKGNYNKAGLSAKSGDGLATAVFRCATPTARDWRSGKASQAPLETNSRPLSEQIGGSLNPTWVEWLMGWPLGWTDLKPWETGRFRSARRKHGTS